jgi:hypothetical protein
MLVGAASLADKKNKLNDGMIEKGISCENE